MAESIKNASPKDFDRLITPPIHCGEATILVRQAQDEEPAKYALPGRRFTTCRNEARRVAVEIDNIFRSVIDKATAESRRRSI